jgi:hypothetical protein
MPSWLLAGGEIVTGLALFAGLSFLVAVLRPPSGTLQERRVVRFPGAWIIVGLALTFAFGSSFALIAVGLGILH